MNPVHAHFAFSLILEMAEKWLLRSPLRLFPEPPPPQILAPFLAFPRLSPSLLTLLAPSRPPPITEPQLINFLYWPDTHENTTLTAPAKTIFDDYSIAYLTLAQSTEETFFALFKKTKAQQKSNAPATPGVPTLEQADLMFRGFDQLHALDSNCLQQITDQLKSTATPPTFPLSTILDRRTRARVSKEIRTNNHEAKLNLWELAPDCNSLTELALSNKTLLEDYSRELAAAALARFEFDRKVARRIIKMPDAEYQLEHFGQELNEGQSALLTKIADVNRRYYWLTFSLLDPIDAYQFHRLYLKTIYPTRFREVIAIEQLLAETLTLPSLTETQKTALGTSRAEYRNRILLLEQQWLRIRTTDLQSAVDQKWESAGREGKDQAAQMDAIKLYLRQGKTLEAEMQTEHTHITNTRIKILTSEQLTEFDRLQPSQ